MTLAQPDAVNAHTDALVEAAVDRLAASVEASRRTGDNSYMFTSAAGIRYDWLPQSDGTTIIRGTQNVQDILEANKTAYNAHDPHIARKQFFRAVSRVPAVVRNKVLIETNGGVDLWRSDTDEKWIKRFLNDSDNRAFRTAPGRL